VCAIADVYDALISARPYKAAWPVSEALAEVERMAGHAFDPYLVRLFLSEIAPQALESKSRKEERRKEGFGSSPPFLLLSFLLSRA